MKDKAYYDEKFQELMDSIAKFLRDPDISDFDKKSSVGTLIGFSVNESCHTNLEAYGMFEWSKDLYKEQEDSKHNAKNN